MRKKILAGMSVVALVIVVCLAFILKNRQVGLISDAHEKTASPQKADTPKLEDKSSTTGIYKLGKSLRSASEQNKLYLFISVEPQNFTRAKMVTLAHQLKQDFPDEPRLLAIILDDENVARNSAGVANELELFQVAERGAYYLNRAEHDEYIEFSTERGKPPNEIRVKLNP